MAELLPFNPAQMYDDMGSALGGKHGAELLCRRCGAREFPTPAQLGGYVRSGWPRHCGETMTLEQRKEPHPK